MANVDATAGANRYNAKTTNKPGMCLWEVQVNGYGPAAMPSTGPHAGQYPIAYNGWLYATQRFTDANPPKGAAVYFGPSPTRTDKNKNAGDVCISLGGGLIRCSDGAGAGRMATMTIAARAKAIARPYLGYTTDFLGHQLVNLGPRTGDNGTGTVSYQYVKDQLGVTYVTGLQKQLGITADGLVGPQTIKALQKWTGVKETGTWVRTDNTAIQTKLGIKPDGLWGPATTLAIKAAIDAELFAPVAPPDPTPVEPEPEPVPEPEPETPVEEPVEPDPIEEPPADEPPTEDPAEPETPAEPVSIWGLIVGGIIVGAITLWAFLTGGTP